MGYRYASINVPNDEREAYLDAFNTCETYLREEAAQAAQLFDDLGGYCPSDLDTCEPLEANGDGEAANARFKALLHALGIDTPEDLETATGASPAYCQNVMRDPLRSDGKQRARVLKGLEDSSAVDVWNTQESNAGIAVGEGLALWARENFKTPHQFARQARECELKCYLVGAVGSLKDTEVQSLLNAPSLANALKDAAAIAEGLDPERARAARAIDQTIDALTWAKSTLTQAFEAVPKAHDKGQG